MTDPTSVPYSDDTARIDEEAPQPHGRALGGAHPAGGQSDAADDASGDLVDDPRHRSGDAPVATGDPETDAEQLTSREEDPDLERPADSETDVLASRISGADDHVGMAALWRATMALPHWWFVAVGEEGMQSPAAAEIDGQLMLMTFTEAERARHFAVGAGMIGEDDVLEAIALPPEEIVRSAAVYADAGISGLMFDPQMSGYFIPTSQLPIVWDAVRGTDAGGNGTFETRQG